MYTFLITRELWSIMRSSTRSMVLCVGKYSTCMCLSMWILILTVNCRSNCRVGTLTQLFVIALATSWVTVWPFPRFYVGLRPTMMVVDPEMIKQVMVKEFSTFMEREVSPKNCLSLQPFYVPWNLITHILTSIASATAPSLSHIDLHLVKTIISPNGNLALCLPVISSLFQYFPNFLDSRKNAPKGLIQQEGEEWRKARQMLSPAFSTAKMRMVSKVKGQMTLYFKHPLASTSDGSPCEEQLWDIGWEAGRVCRVREKCGCFQVCMCTGVLFFWHATMYCGLLSYTHSHTNTCTPTCMQQLQIFHHGNHSSCCFRPGREPPTRGSWSTHWCLCSPLLKLPGGGGGVSWILNPFAEWVMNWDR